MMFFRALNYDIRNGTLSDIKKYILLFAMSVGFCIDYYLRLQSLCKINNINAKSTFADYYFYIFSGRTEYVPSRGESFSFPAIWTLLFVIVLFIVLIYPFRDMNDFGRLVLINTKSRKLWWYSKCCYIIFSSVIINLTIIAAVLFFTIISGGKVDAEVSAYALAIASKRSYLSFNSFEIGLYMLSPFFVLTAMGILQMLCSLILKPNVSYMLSIAHIISAAFYSSPVLFANYAMLLRCNKAADDGFLLVNGIILSVTVTIASAIIGSVLFARHDILNKE